MFFLAGLLVLMGERVAGPDCDLHDGGQPLHGQLHVPHPAPAQRERPARPGHRLVNLTGHLSIQFFQSDALEHTPVVGANSKLYGHDLAHFAPVLGG